MKNNSIKIRVKKKIGAISEGATVVIPVDHEGTPLDYFWRKKFKDAKIDDSIEILDKKDTIGSKASKTRETPKIK